MRNFDNWTCYRDLKGNILRGCVQFNVKGGNTQAPIFDRNGTAIANPQITDILGRTQHQVFIDEDVTAYFYKYIGDGTIAAEEAQGIDTSDVSRWALQFTCDNVLAFGASFDSLSAMEIGTMSGLRTIDPESVPNVNGVKEIILGGYYEAGDCEQVRYLWDAESTDADDNGSVIKCNDLLTGRWILVTPTEHCDSRHFGVFPQASAFALVDHTTRIAQLVAYCNKVSIRPLFNGSDDTPFFIYSFLNVVCNNAIDVSEGTKFEDKNDSRITAEFNGNPLFQNGNTELVTKKCRTSWKYKSVTGYSEVIIDDDGITQKTYSDAKVSVIVPVSGFTFNSCAIESLGNLGDNTFSSCELKGPMFVNDATAPVVDDGCVLKASDFAGKMPLWIKMRAQQTNHDWNCENMALGNDCVVGPLESVTLISAIFDNAAVVANEIKFERCRGAASVIVHSLGISHSELDLDVEPSVTVDECVVSKSMVTFVTSEHVANFGDLNVNSSSVFSSQQNKVIVNGDFNANDCVIGASMDVHGDFFVSRTDINRPVVLKEGGTMKCNLMYCEVNAQITLSPSTQETVFQGSLCFNHGTVQNPVAIDRTNFSALDSAHSYSYKGNKGTFLEDSVVVERPEIMIWRSGTVLDATTDLPFVLFRMVRNVSLTIQSCSFQIRNLKVGFDEVEFFRIGSDNFLVKASLESIPNGGWFSNNGSPMNATLEARLVSGNKFALFATYKRSGGVLPDYGNIDFEKDIEYCPDLWTNGSGNTVNANGVVSGRIKYEVLDKH